MIKKLIYIFISIIIFTNPVLAHSQSAKIRYEGYPYAFNKGDYQKFLKNAEVDMLLFEKSQTKEDREYYLQEAMRNYFLVEKTQTGSIDAHIGLGRIYDEMKLDRYAKEHFFTALNINPQNAKANLHFGNFYYKRKQLVDALFYYKRAYNLGYQHNYYLNQRLGALYEKLADIDNAKTYYERAYILNHNDPQIIEKIRFLDNLNYSGNQYYLFDK